MVNLDMSEIITAFFTEGIPNYFISRKIDLSVNSTKNKINTVYFEYQKNIIILSVLNGLFIIVSIISSIINSFSNIGIIIASALLIILTGRTVYLIVRIIMQILSYRGWITYFLKIAFKEWSFQRAIENIIRNNCQIKYYKTTNAFTSKIHSLCAYLGIVKSACEIENEVAQKYYHMIREHLFGNILYKILILFICYGVYANILQPLLIRFTLGMNWVEILYYPIRMMRLMG